MKGIIEWFKNLFAKFNSLKHKLAGLVDEAINVVAYAKKCLDDGKIDKVREQLGEIDAYLKIIKRVLCGNK